MVGLTRSRLDGFDWYAAGARVLLDRQRPDGSWPDDRWGSLPNTCLALVASPTSKSTSAGRCRLGSIFTYFR